MARNVIASKRGWGYDYANSLLNAYVDGVALVNLSANTTGGTASLGVSMTFTQTTAVSHAALEGIVTYTPSTAGSGGAVPIGVRAKVTLSDSCTSTLYMWAVQAQLDFGSGSTLDADAGQVAAIRAVLTNTGNTSWTNGNIAGIYVDNLIDDDMSVINRQSTLLRLADHGGGLNSMISFYSKSSTDCIFNFEDDNANFTTISSGGVHGGTIQKVRCVFAGTTYYMIMSTTPTS